VYPRGPTELRQLRDFVRVVQLGTMSRAALEPDVRLHTVESLSGHLSSMLDARQLDLAVLFDTAPGRRWSVTPQRGQAISCPTATVV
jgi:DNA-binding transcriptional LysR family regulator